MIRKSALKMSAVMAGRGIISAEDMDVYAYGFELMISTAVNILLIILISVLYAKPWAWCFFLLPFIPLRLTAGGYHAGTHLGCCLAFCVGYAVLMLPGVFLTPWMTPAVLLCLSAANLCLVLLLSPMPAGNKPLEAAQKAVNRKRSIIIAALALTVTAVSVAAGPRFLWMFVFFALGQAGAGVSLVVAKLVHKG